MTNFKKVIALFLIWCLIFITEACTKNELNEKQKMTTVTVESANQMESEPKIAASLKVFDDAKYLGSKLPYPYEKTNDTVAPDAYHPVFIQYVGRHGSRHLTKSKYDITLFNLLSIAEKEKQITQTGIELKEQIEQLLQFEKENYGQLTKLGRNNLNKIGEREAINYKEIFSHEKAILGYSTHVQRTQDSRDEFFSGLKKGVTGNKIITSFYPKNKDPYLRPFKIAPQYIKFKKDGKWKEKMNDYIQNEKGKMNNKRVLTQFFSEEFYNRLDNGEFQLKDSKGSVALKNPTDAATNLFNLYIHSPSLAEEGGNFNFKKYFTSKELAWYASIVNREEFYSKGPSMENNEVTVNIMAPLVKFMIVSSENALQNKNYAGIFSFAHAETMIPLAAFLEIDGGCESTDDPNKVTEIWNVARIAPMCSNIQWVFYSNSNDYLVKMLLNEKEIAFPMKTVSYPYYKWEDVKAYYTKKVEALGVSLNSSLEDNIITLKENY